MPEVAKTKVSKPKRYSLSKLRLCHAPLKRLIQTRPHMSTSRCGNICVRRGFSNHSSVDAAVSGRSCVFLCESKSTLFGLSQVTVTVRHRLCVCVLACVREGDMVTQPRLVYCTFELHHCVCHVTLFLFQA